MATTMTPRERYVACLKFEEVDRIPLSPGGGRESTRRAWESQGLPKDQPDYHKYVRELLGIEPEPEGENPWPGIVLTMIPEFEEKVIEHRPAKPGSEYGVKVVQDWKGNICEIADCFEPSYLRGAPDFVTRAWLRCPVESRKEWPDMARRYDANDPSRFPADWDQRCRTLKNRIHPSTLIFSGPFWQLREWLGFEELCMMTLDDPDFVKEMIKFWEDFVADMLTKAFEQYVPDAVMVNEDMAYKEKPMIGPEMSRELLLPCWRRWGEICKAAGVSVYGVDSDGFIESLIPVWLDAGFEWNGPVEVAAGNDMNRMRADFGKRMAYTGGVDKRAMAKGGQVIRDEIDRLKPVMDSGGYIPGCDHGIPHDVSWPNFVDYCRLLAQATGWLD